MYLFIFAASLVVCAALVWYQRQQAAAAKDASAEAEEKKRASSKLKADDASAATVSSAAAAQKRKGAVSPAATVAKSENVAAAASAEQERKYLAFRRNYLLVYLLAFGADWLQGPYLYDLYESYGFSRGEIGALFIAGYGSSLCIGTLVGSMVDVLGRRLGALCFCVLYGCACVITHFPVFPILMIGRLCGGTATSLLYSTFESWMVHEHHARHFTSDQLSSTFSIASFLNGVVAISAGVAAYVAKGYLGPVAAYEMSLLLLFFTAIVVYTSWGENYGQRGQSTSGLFGEAFRAIRRDPRIVFLGLAQGLFEGGMFVFVFMWTPTMRAYDRNVPHGIVFSTFMVCCMIGSTLFKLLCAHIKTAYIFLSLLALSALSMLPPIIAQVPAKAAVDDSVQWLSLLPIYCSFLMFEVCVGVFWPACGTLRSEIFPDNCRSTLINMFRLLLNALVIIVLIKVGELSTSFVFSLVFGGMSLAFGCQYMVARTY